MNKIYGGGGGQKLFTMTDPDIKSQILNLM